ncbi:MAG: hypothetical protein ACRDSP_20675 [Pseudonocardiaceae bacterium]
MSDARSFAELDGQEVELLPARTVMSLYGGSYGHHHDPNGNSSEATAVNFNHNTAINHNEIESDYSLLGSLLGMGGGTPPVAAGAGGGAVAPGA